MGKANDRRRRTKPDGNSSHGLWPGELKTELYEIIKLKKPEPVYKTNEFLHGKGDDVLHPPPYHCEFNPIEMVWEDVN